MAKYRHELKYHVSQAEIPLLQSRLHLIMHHDSHVSESGSYIVRSLYFDDYMNQCFYDNENGTDPREKFRIRIYQHSTERILLECKRKERGKTLKASCQLTRTQAESLMNHKIPVLDNQAQLLQKLALQMQTRLLRPVIIVEYERIPFIYIRGNVRVTFDTNLSSSSDISSFFSEEVAKRPVMPQGQHLMEVKYDEFLPDYIYQALNMGVLRQTAFSKYYICRKYSLKEG